MKKKVIRFTEYSYPWALEPTRAYVTEDGCLYELGDDVTRDQIQRVRGGIEEGGETYLYVKK